MNNLPRDFKAFPSRPGWFKTAAGDYAVLERSAIELQEQFPLDVQIVCASGPGDLGHAIYLIENISAVELARQFGTGTHNEWHDPKTEKMCSELERVYKVAPFRPYFVDTAGYKARFKEQITAEQAAEIEGILTLGLEGYENEWSGEGPILEPTLVLENGIRLWWD